MNDITQGPIGSAAPTPIPTSPTGTGKKDLGKDEFLKLLITQLRYQDPMDPSKPEEFASQLAQFSSLEGMKNIESLLQEQSSGNALTTLAMKADLGASFIGRKVMAAGNAVELSANGPASVSVDIGTGGGKAVLTITDSSGKVVATRDCGFKSGGRQVLTTGTTALPAGDYTYSVAVTATDGTDVPVQTYTSGIIDGVSFLGGTVVLKSGKMSFALDNVVEVEQAPAAQAALAAIQGARILPSQLESAHP